MGKLAEATPPVLPNLLVTGVQKGGTTWLHTTLGSHDDVFMSRVKELRYFDALDRVQSEPHGGSISLILRTPATWPARTAPSSSGARL